MEITSIAELNQQLISRVQLGGIPIRRGARRDVAAEAVAARMRFKMAGYRAEVTGLQEAISREQVRGGALEVISGALERMRELSIRAGGILTAEQRGMIQIELEQLKAGITETAERAKFRGVPVIPEMTAEELGIEGITAAAFEEAIGAIERAAERVAERQARVGVAVSGYEAQIEQLMVQWEETAAAEAGISV
jgi:flagellin-like hook-associated protein FlgL